QAVTRPVEAPIVAKALTRTPRRQAVRLRLSSVAAVCRSLWVGLRRLSGRSEPEAKAARMGGRASDAVFGAQAPNPSRGAKPGLQGPVHAPRNQQSNRLAPPPRLKTADRRPACWSQAQQPPTSSRPPF